MINIWFFDLRKFESKDFYKSLELFPLILQNDIKKYQFEKDRNSSLIARLLLRKAIIDTGHSISLLDNWKRGPFNKPFIEGWDYFNISHSGDFVVLCFCTTLDIGIDIERIDTKIDVVSLLTYFNENEKDFILNSNDKTVDFFHLWTRKEAVLKGISHGFYNGLKENDCSQNVVRNGNEYWFLKEVKIVENYICYLAYTTVREIGVKVREIKF